MKKWVDSESRYLYFFGLAIYLIGLVFLSQSFRYKNIAIVSIMLVFFNVAILSLVSWLYFKETLNTPLMIGLVLGLISITLLETA